MTATQSFLELSPHASTIRIEQCLLGTLILFPVKYHEVRTLCNPKMFTGDNVHIAENIWDKGGEVDPNVLAYELEKDHGLDQVEVLQLTQKANKRKIHEWAKAISDRYLNEQEILIHQQTLSRLLEGEDYRDFRGEVEEKRQEIYGHTEDKKASRAARLLDFKERIVEANKKRKEGVRVGIPSGFPEVDRRMGGWHPTDLIIQAARPGMGKTTGMLESALAAASELIPVLVLSLEMSDLQITAKLVQKHSGVSRQSMEFGDIDEDSPEMAKIDSALEYLHDIPLFIEDGIHDFDQIIDTIRMYVKRYGVQLVLIDYLQLISYSGRGPLKRNLQIGQMTRKLKQISSAKDCNVATILLSQLSRAVEQRGGLKIPMLSDLRDSGEIEQDADLIYFWWRPDYYGIKEDENGDSLEGQVRLIQAKNRRYGFLHEYKLGYDVQHDRMEEWDSDKDFKAQSPTYTPQIAPPDRKRNDEDIPF